MTPTNRPTGWVLIGKDNAPATPTLYTSLRTACDAEETYRAATGKRALPTPVWSREAWRADHLHEEEDA